jgi:hypothetical protein
MIGKVPWVSQFDHFYLTRKEVIDIIVSYFKDGLESNEFCICATTEPLTAEEVRKAMGETVPDFPKYLGKGQIEMLSYAQWHLNSIRATAFIGEQAFIWHMPWLEQGKPQPATPSQ